MHQTPIQGKAQPSALWAHLLRKPTNTALPTATPHTQLAPADKTNTATRILLHDTHARLENFGERAGQLVQEVESARREVVRVGQEAEVSREKAGEEVVQLVNRCQTTLQKSIGEPAQVRAIADLQSEIMTANTRLLSYETKLDALHMLVQTQSQTLQALQDHHVRAQDHHAQTVALVAPLLPILRALPLHIDLSRAAVVEKINEIPSPPAPAPCACRVRYRELDDCDVGSVSPSRKRRRLTEPEMNLSPPSPRSAPVKVVSPLSQPPNSLVSGPLGQNRAARVDGIHPDEPTIAREESIENMPTNGRSGADVVGAGDSSMPLAHEPQATPPHYITLSNISPAYTRLNAQRPATPLRITHQVGAPVQSSHPTPATPGLCDTLFKDELDAESQLDGPTKDLYALVPSLKNRSIAMTSGPGKRFIPIDDDDEEESTQ